MAHVSKTPISRLMQEEEQQDEAGSSSGSRSRGDYKKMRELEEMRKAGSAPAAVDEHGKVSKHSVKISEIYFQGFLAKITWNQCMYLRKKLLFRWE